MKNILPKKPKPVEIKAPLKIRNPETVKFQRNRHHDHQPMSRNKAAALVQRVLSEDRPFIDEMYKDDKKVRAREDAFRANLKAEFNAKEPVTWEDDWRYNHRESSLAVPVMRKTVDYVPEIHASKAPVSGAHTLNDLQVLALDYQTKDPTLN